MNIQKVITQLDYIWNSTELIQAGMNTEPIFDSALSGVEASIDNIILRTDSVITTLIRKNSRNINKPTDYLTFVALGIRYMSQFGEFDNSSGSYAKFGKSFDNLNWPSNYPFSKKDMLIAFTRSVENSFNISLLDSHYTSPINLS